MKSFILMGRIIQFYSQNAIYLYKRVIFKKKLKTVLAYLNVLFAFNKQFRFNGLDNAF